MRVACLLAAASLATAATLTVPVDHATIQSCADAAQPGDTCLVLAGTYTETGRTGGGVATVRSGAVGSPITFRASGVVTMAGFTINHQHIVVDGFDITGHTTAGNGLLEVKATGSACTLSNNTIRDGAPGVYGINLRNDSAGNGPNGCTVTGNSLASLASVFLQIFGDGHLFERNTMSVSNNNDYVRLHGSGAVFRRNVFWQGSGITTGNHADFLQTFGYTFNGVQVGGANALFEENWIADLPGAQVGQMNATDGSVLGMLYPGIVNITFRRNVFVNVFSNANIAMPGVHWENNTFFNQAFDPVSGLGVNYSGSLARGVVSNGLVKNNVFLAGGANATPTRGWYHVNGNYFNEEAVRTLVTGEGGTHPISTAIAGDLQANGYTDSNGVILSPSRALADISQFTWTLPSPTYDQYKTPTYTYLTQTATLDTELRDSFYADYNFVAGASPGFAAKQTSGCVAGGPGWSPQNFCEANGINGGDPGLSNIANAVGADGIPFTLDDGLKPIPDSPLCGAGANDADIGAYSCDPSLVFPPAHNYRHTSGQFTGGRQ